MKPASRRPHVPSRQRSTPGASDMIRRKKVKFADSASIHGESCKQDVSFLSKEKPLAQSSDGAKTFEYKSFKKLLEETCHKCHSYQLSKEDRNLKTHERGKPMEGNSSLCILKGTPFVHKSSHSPAMVVQNNELNDIITNNYKMSNFLSPIQVVTPFVKRSSLSPSVGSEKCGPECKHGGLFSKKRESLLHLAADAFCLQVDEFTLNRSELILELLQRVGIKEKLSKNNSNGRYQSVTSSKSDSFLEDVHATYQTEFGAVAVQKNSRKNIPAHDCKEAYNFILSSWDLPVSQALPTWHDSQGQLLVSSKLDAHFEETLEIGGAELVATSSRKHLGNKLLTDSCKKADELILSAQDHIDFQDFPSWHTPETGFCSEKRPSKWVLDCMELSDRCSDSQSTSAVELRTDFEFSQIQCHEVDHLLCKLNFLDPDKFPFHHQILKQALVPYVNSSHFKPCDLHDSDFLKPTREQCTLPLLGWGSENTEKEADLLASTSDSMLPVELDDLSLNLCGAPSLLDRTKGCMFNDICEGIYKFNSPLRSRCKITDWDESYQNLHNILRARPGFKLECKNSPKYFNKEYCSQLYANPQFHEGSIQNILNCMSSGYRLQAFIDEPNLMET